jgi:beta-galactosidase
MVAAFPPVSPKAPYIWHGGDYNPEQWPSAVWEEDFDLMQQAGMTSATVGVFSWVSLEPSEGVYTFDWLDKIMDGLQAHGLKTVLATPSAAQPAWLSAAYPDVMYADDNGVRQHHGRRVNYCPNSPNYRRLSVKIAQELANRYKDHPALLLWHISNEYGGENGANCMCDNCATAFRDWLKAKYQTLDNLNGSWWTRFWGHTFTDWSQITPPYSNGENKIHGLTIDYRRFMTDSYLACYKAERDAIRAITPAVPITTNLMGTYRPLDYRKWAPEMDVIAWDCYPWPNADAAEVAFMHDLNRGLKDGQPFLLMEQTPSSQNWQPYNALKRPGVLRLWSYLAVAHGADSVQYFQWRRGRGGFEKFHSAVIEHASRADTRIFREVSQIGEELHKLGNTTVGAATNAKVAIMYDWDNRWAIEDASGPVQDKKYLATVIKHYRALYRKNVSIDVVFPDSDLSRYEILVAPMLYMIKPGVAEKIEAFVERGGAFVTTYFSGITDENDLAFEGGYPGPLRRVTGVWAEEIDALYPGQTNTIVMADRSGAYACDHLAEVLHADTARVMATFGSDFYKGSPALTENNFGNGKAYYIASDPNDEFLNVFYGELLARYVIQPVLPYAPRGVEVTERVKGEDRLVFILNHNAQPVELHLGAEEFDDLLSGQRIAGSIKLEGYDVRILQIV